MFHATVPVIRVTSLEAAKRFYCEDLGFALMFEWKANASRPDPGYMGLSRDGAIVHVSSFPGDGVVGSVTYFTVADVDRLHGAFVEKGVAIDLVPTAQPWGMREMYIKDPDGNKLRFGQMPGK